MKILSNLWFAIAVTIGLILGSSAYAAATIGTSAQWSGGLASGLAAGAGGMWVGTVTRRRHRRRPR